MKYAILSDVHSNTKALRRVLDAAHKAGAERVICLGDVVGYGPDPAGAVRLCREECDVVLMGNHDAAVCGLRSMETMSEHAEKCALLHRAMLDKEDLDWLRSLPYVHREDGFAAAHGEWCRPEAFGYVADFAEIRNQLWELAKDDLQVLFLGHTHAPMSADWGFISPIASLDARDMAFVQDHIYFANPGSVGYPRVRRAATYAIYDSQAKTVTHHSIEFDIEEYMSDLESANVPVAGWLKGEYGV